MTEEPVGGRYTLIRELGRGGMGCVYEARHMATGRRVALKIISRDLARKPRIAARFEVEVKAAGALDSEHIVQVFDAGFDERRGTPFLAMEYLIGEDLESVLHRLGPLSPDLVLRIGAQACLGLEKAHAQGIVHRDIKPGNLFLAERDGGELRLKLIDFGIAKVLGPAPERVGAGGLTRVGMLLGSPLYMSPEQVRSPTELDARSDLWSLGVVLYQALTGVTPFHDLETMDELMVAICVGPIPPLRARAQWVDPAVAGAIERALVLEPGQRYQSAREMGEALGALLREGASIRSAMLVPATAGAGSAGGAASSTAALAMARTAVGTPLSGRPAGATALEHARTEAVAPAGATIPGAYVPALLPIAPIATRASAPVAVPPPPARTAPAAPGRGALAVVIVGAFVLGVIAVVAIGRRGRHGRGRDGVPTAVASALVSRSSSTGTAAPSAPVPTAAPAPPTDGALAVLAALAGAWRSDSGRIYDAVLVDRALEFRVRDPRQFAGQGYVEGEARFTLSPASPDAPDTFPVEDHLRPAPPEKTSYDLPRARETCSTSWRTVNGRPLVATAAGDRLSVALVQIEPSLAMFVREGARVVGCERLAEARTLPITSALRRQ